MIVLLGRMSIADGVEVEAWVPKELRFGLAKKNTSIVRAKNVSHVDSSGGSGHIFVQVHGRWMDFLLNLNSVLLPFKSLSSRHLLVKYGQVAPTPTYGEVVDNGSPPKNDCRDEELDTPATHRLALHFRTVVAELSKN